METQLIPAANSTYRDIVQHAASRPRRILACCSANRSRRCARLEMAAAYRDTLLFLETHARAIAKLLAALPRVRTAAPGSGQLPRALRARRGQNMMLGDCLWHVYAMSGKLDRRVYLLSADEPGR